MLTWDQVPIKWNAVNCKFELYLRIPVHRILGPVRSHLGHREVDHILHPAHEPMVLTQA